MIHFLKKNPWEANYPANNIGDNGGIVGRLRSPAVSTAGSVRPLPPLTPQKETTEKVNALTKFHSSLIHYFEG